MGGRLRCAAAWPPAKSKANASDARRYGVALIESPVCRSGRAVGFRQIAVGLSCAELAQSRGRVFEDFDRRAAAMAAGLAERRVDGRETAALCDVDLRAALNEEVDDVVPAPERGAEQRRAPRAARGGTRARRACVQVGAGVEQQRQRLDRPCLDVGREVVRNAGPVTVRIALDGADAR